MANKNYCILSLKNNSNLFRVILKMSQRSKTVPKSDNLSKNTTSPFVSQGSKRSRKSTSTKEDKQKNSKETSHYTKFSQKIFKGDEYLPQFIKEVALDSNYFKCMKCKDPKTKQLGKLILVNGFQNHLNSEEHEGNTPNKEKARLEKAKETLSNLKNKNDQSKNKNDEQDVPNYLNLIAFMLSENLSYSQVENILKYLQKVAKDNGLKFLKNFNFDQRFLSKITQNCFGPILKEELENKLNQTKYSLIIDNATFCGESFCAIKVKYLDSDWNEEIQSNITCIKNKIIALSSLKESSSGRTLQNILETRLFWNKEVKKNMVGFAHDNGSNFAGEYTGLAALLSKEENNFFDLQDPCHGLDLTIKHSLKALPPKIDSFIHSVAYDFAFPKKKALLKKIQEERNYQVLYPKQLAQTRWLSLGESLVRLLQIWDSLKLFYESVDKLKQGKKKRKNNRQIIYEENVSIKREMSLKEKKRPLKR